MPAEREPSLLLNVFQSVAERAPVVVELAMLMPNTPETLLYVSGQSAESEVRVILVATVPERVLRLPERVAMLDVFVAVCPERVEMFPVAVARFEFVVARLLLVVAREPETVVMFVVFVVVCPERVAMFPERVFTVPERAFCALASVKYRLVPSTRFVVDLRPNAVSKRD